MVVQNFMSHNILKPQLDTALHKVVSQINTNFENKTNQDTVTISQKALDILDKQNKNKDTNQAKEEGVSTGYQKYSEGMFTKDEWAENALMEQRDGMQTVLDIIDHAKSKLEFTMSKIESLENFLSGTASHSNPNMTKETAEAYLHNYKQSIQSDYTAIIKQHIGIHRFFTDEYDELSGGMASQIIENQLNSITAESLGLANLSSDPKEIVKALENASEILGKNMKYLENAFYEETGKRDFSRKARSRSIFDGSSSLSFFESRMENGYRILNTNLNFSGETLDIGISSIADLQMADKSL